MIRLLPFATLVVTGAAWGATQPLAKIAVSEGYRHFGLIFWQTVLVGLLLGALTLLKGKRLPLHPPALRLYLFIAVVGTVVPGIASYQAAVHLPSGVLSILLSSVPMFALPIALALGTDRLSFARLMGLLLGLGGVALLVLPEASLPAGTEAVWIAIALIASACYALEGNMVAKWGTQGLDAVQVLTGASVLGAVLSLPLALASGQFIVPSLPLGGPDKAVLASAVLHAFAYSAYVWLVGRAGAVFAAQVSYLVTLFGVTWAMLFLSEAYTGWVWAALILMMAGMALVQPQRKPLVPDRASRQNTVG
ncbi:DMT family transporter [Antarctobacter sp.]|uniref:DMT family transporter n=1 Tax=Antarctobacter sp. TaxID=1872577 RepID=UPI002B277A25|nr:DMT family transporter [Antarctobacter sp.]